MTPQEFYKKMCDIKNRQLTDDEYGEEDGHMDSDSLMERTLIDLGYGDGIKVNRSIAKYYC